MARRIDSEMREATSGDAAEGSASALIELAERKVAAGRQARKASDQPSTRRRKRKPVAEDVGDDPAFAEAPTPGGSALDGVPAGPSGWFTKTGIQIWTAAGICAATALLVLSLVAVGDAPVPLPVSNVTISWLPGPRVPDAEVLAWLKRCPQYEKLTVPNDWVLGKLADHLRSLPAVAEVRRVALFHEPGKINAIRRVPGKPPVQVQVAGIRRTVEIQLALRQPYLPAVLKDGSRVWIDGEGIVLPGVLPSPGVQRPLIRQVEAGGRDGVRAAVDLWQRLEPQVEKGLVSDIVLADALDAQAPAPAPTASSPALAPPPAPVARGIVLYTRQGARLVWGRPGEEQYGVTPEEKARDLVHTLKCQGDLSRIATINVRFKEPFYQLR